MGEDVNGYEVTVESTTPVPVEEWFEAKLINIIKKQAKFGPVFNFIFRPSDDEHENTTVPGQMGVRVSDDVNTKSYKWYSGLAGHELEEGEKLNIKDFIDNVYEIFVEEKKGENRTFQNVTKVRTFKDKETTKKDTKKEKTNKKEKKETKPTKSADEGTDFDLNESDIPF